MSLGGSQTTQQQIPAWLQGPSIRAIQRGEDIAQVGYVPYFGPDVAALTPMQASAMQNASNAASAFGLSAPTDAMAGMPDAQTFAGGVRGYSSAPLYNESLGQLQEQRPNQFDYINSFFIDPMTGTIRMSQQPQMAQSQMGQEQFNGFQNDNYNDFQQGGVGSNPAGQGFAGYSGFRDMFDGGGPGQSGSTFQGGGLISGAANMVASPIERDGGGGGGGGGGK